MLPRESLVRRTGDSNHDTPTLEQVKSMARASFNHAGTRTRSMFCPRTFRNMELFTNTPHH
jgi:hypothetical protein